MAIQSQAHGHRPSTPCVPTQSAGTRACCVALLLLLLTGCAGWQFGGRSLYRPDIRTVYVPPVDSASFRRNLGERLTEALVREIEQKSTFKVVSDPNADSILRCAIITDSKMVINETR